MKIFALRYNRQSFGTTKSSYTLPIEDKLTQNIVYRTSEPFRWDLNWDNAFRIFDVNFSNKNKVNVLSLGCSDGSEAYSIVIGLNSFMGEKKAQKFLPIKACDINSEVIQFNKNGFWNLSGNCVKKIEKYTDNKSQYIKEYDRKVYLSNEDKSHNIRTYKVTDKLKNCVEFEQAKLEDILANIEDDSNTIVFCRNVFPYFNDSAKVHSIIKETSKHLKEGSLFITGHFDNYVLIGDMLRDNGFVQLDEYIFRKSK